MFPAFSVGGSSLERHSPTLFLVAGILLVGYATLNGVTALTVRAVEQNPFQFGYVVGFLGLLGLYPRIGDVNPWLARVGGVAAVLGLVGISAITIGALTDFGAGSTESVPVGPLFIGMTLIGFVVGYLAFGVASLLSGRSARITGLVLVVPGVIVVLMLGHIAAGLDSEGTAFVISAGQAMAHLAIGATLRSEADSADLEEAESDAPTDATAKG